MNKHLPFKQEETIVGLHDVRMFALPKASWGTVRKHRLKWNSPALSERFLWASLRHQCLWSNPRCGKFQKVFHLYQSSARFNQTVQERTVQERSDEKVQLSCYRTTKGLSRKRSELFYVSNLRANLNFHFLARCRYKKDNWISPQCCAACCLRSLNSENWKSIKQTNNCRWSGV